MHRAVPDEKLVVYLSYGQGAHVDENIYSILTLFRFLSPQDRRWRVVVYTDDPAPFRGLPVTIEPLGPAVLADWAGPFGYGHRRKTMCILDALQRFRRPLMFVDGDTWFRRHPRSILDRVEPGRAFLHLRERRLRLDPAWRDWSAPADMSADMPADPVMWNSGVVAVHPADASGLRVSRSS
jgi:hypothetical protein